MEMYGKLRERLVHLARKKGAVEPEDCADETLMRFLERYCQEAPQDIALIVLRAEERLATLFTVLRNVVMERVRHYRRAGDAPETELAGPDQTPEQLVVEKVRTQCVRACITKLPTHEAHVLALRADGVSYRQIARIMQATEAAVTSWIHRSKSALRKCIQEDCPGYGRKGAG